MFDTIGSVLRYYREEAGYSLTDFENIHKISVSQLRALESDDLQRLPADLYVTHFIRAYAKTLSLNEQKLLALFDEQKQRTYAENPPLSQATAHASGRAWVTPRIIKLVLVIASVLLILTYLTRQVILIYREPLLVINEPASNNIIIRQSYIDFVGSTEPEAIVSINDKEIAINSAGGFSSTVDLQKGLNIIKISSQKKHSRAAVIYQQVLVE